MQNKKMKFDNLKEKKFIKKENPFFCSMIKKGILTEKTSRMELEENCVSFFTDVSVGKFLIKNAIAQIFTTKVLNVRTMIIHPKRKQHQGRKFYKPVLKKVMVRIENMEGIGAFFNE